MGILWGLRGQSGEQVGGHFALTHPERAPVGVATGPAGVMAGRDRHIGVTELGGQVPELYSRGEELGGKRIAQVLWAPRADFRRSARPSEGAPTVVTFDVQTSATGSYRWPALVTGSLPPQRIISVPVQTVWA